MNFMEKCFLNQSKNDANVVSRKDGYFTIKDVKEGEELLLLQICSNEEHIYNIYIILNI